MSVTIRYAKECATPCLAPSCLALFVYILGRPRVPHLYLLRFRRELPRGIDIDIIRALGVYRRNPPSGAGIFTPSGRNSRKFITGGRAHLVAGAIEYSTPCLGDASPYRVTLVSYHLYLLRFRRDPPRGIFRGLFQNYVSGGPV